MAGLSITQNFRKTSKKIFQAAVVAGVIGATAIGAGYGVQALDDHSRSAEDNRRKATMNEAFIAGQKAFVYGKIGKSGEPKVFEIKCEGGSVNAFRVSIDDEGMRVVSEKPLVRSSIPTPLCPQ